MSALVAIADVFAAGNVSAWPLQLSGEQLEQLRLGAALVSVALGLFFTLVSTTGVLRLPDIYARAHTASQADTLGAGFALAGVALMMGWGSPVVKAVLLLTFIFVTNPTAAHAIARAAYEEDVEPWTVEDARQDADREAATDGGRPDADVARAHHSGGSDGNREPGADVGRSDGDHGSGQDAERLDGGERP